MKSKRRHELQTNELADRLGHFVEQVRPYTATILIVVLGVVGIILAWQWLSISRQSERAYAWRAYMTAGTNLQADVTDELSQVADEFQDTTAGAWAAQTMADIELSRGIRRLFEDRALAETSLNVAKGRYREVLESSQANKSALLKNRARLGLAQVHEALNELDDAKQLYSEVVESAAGEVEADVAQQRLAQLNDPQVERWYNWFARQTPAPPPETGEGLGGPGGGLGDLPDLGTLPDAPSEDFMETPPITVPDATPDQAAPDTSPAPEKPATEPDETPALPLSAPEQQTPSEAPENGEGNSTAEPKQDDGQ